MPRVRGQDERPREDRRRLQAPAVHVLRGHGDAQGRQFRQAALALPQVAALEAAAGRARDAGEDLPAQDLALLVHMAGGARLRRGPPRRPRGRAVARKVLRGARRLHRRARRRLAPRQERVEGGAVGAHVPHRPSRRRGARRRGRVRGGEEGGVAANPRPEMHLPCVRAGQALHHDASEAAGRGRALRDREGPPRGPRRIRGRTDANVYR